MLFNVVALTAEVLAVGNIPFVRFNGPTQNLHSKLMDPTALRQIIRLSATFAVLGDVYALSLFPARQEATCLSTPQQDLLYPRLTVPARTAGGGQPNPRRRFSPQKH